MTNLQRARLSTNDLFQERLRGTLIIVAAQLASDQLPVSPTQAQQRRYNQRQKVASYWRENPKHWAEVLAEKVLAKAYLTPDIVANLTKDDPGVAGSDLTQVQSDAMDAALISAATDVSDEIKDLLGNV